jgi:hypothetical protein
MLHHADIEHGSIPAEQCVTAAPEHSWTAQQHPTPATNCKPNYLNILSPQSLNKIIPRTLPKVQPILLWLLSTNQQESPEPLQYDVYTKLLKFTSGDLLRLSRISQGSHRRTEYTLANERIKKNYSKLFALWEEMVKEDQDRECMVIRSKVSRHTVIQTNFSNGNFHSN